MVFYGKRLLTNNFMICKIGMIDGSIMTYSYLWFKFVATGLPSDINNTTMSGLGTTFEKGFLNGFDYRTEIRVESVVGFSDESLLLILL